MYGQFEYAELLIPIYNNLYDRAQALLKRFNPCNVRDGVCERFRRGQGKCFCCEGCVYCGPEGCKVKALRCSLWLCREDLIHPTNQRAWNTEMWNIMIAANEFGLLVARGSMEDSIAQACHLYTMHKVKREVLKEAAANFKPAPLYFDNAIKPEVKVPSFARVQDAYHGMSRFAEKTEVVSDMSEAVAVKKPTLEEGRAARENRRSYLKS